MPDTLSLAELLPDHRVCVPLEAKTLVDAAIEVAGRFGDAVLRDPERLRERIEDARPEDIVGLHGRAFVLHFRTDAMQELAVGLGLATQPLCRVLGDDAERQCARLVLLVCSPPRQVVRHLQVVGAFERLLGRPEAADRVCRDVEAGRVSTSAPLRETKVAAQLVVRDLMTARPRTIGPDAPLRSALQDMVRAGLGGLPVVTDDDRVIGMLGERELLRDLLSRYLPRAGGAVASPSPSVTRRSVRDLMTRQVLCVSPDQPVAEVASLMLNKDVDRVPVVKEGRLVGLLTRGDIVRKLTGA